MVDFLQFIFVVASGHHAAAGLEPEFAVAADKRADDDGLIELTVEAQESDAAGIGTAAVGLKATDNLHGFYFGCAREGAGRKGVDKRLHAIGSFVQLSGDAAHEVDNVAVELHFLILLHFHVVTVAA